MANRSLGTLTIDLVAKIGGFVEGLDKSEKAVKKAQRNIERDVEAISVGIIALGSAAVAAASGLAVLVNNQIDFADASSDAAQKAGLAVEEYTRLAYAFKFGTKEGADLSSTLQFLNKAIAGAGDGVKGNVEDFKALGVAYKNTDGTLRNASEVLDDIADAFKELPDGAKKAALATQFFGKSGADIIAFLNQGSDGIRKFKEEADGLGVTLTGAAADAAGQFNDNLEKIQARIMGATNVLAADLLPAINQITEEFLASGGLADDLAAAIGFVADNAETLAQILETVLYAALGRVAAGAALSVKEMIALRVASVATVGAMASLKTAGSALLGIMGGPVGLAVTAAAVGLSFIDWGDGAEEAAAKTQNLIDKANSLGKSANQLALDTVRRDIADAEKQLKSIAKEYDFLANSLALGGANTSKQQEEKIKEYEELRQAIKKFREEEQRLAQQQAAPVRSTPSMSFDIKKDVAEKEPVDRFDYENFNISVGVDEFVEQQAAIDREQQRIADDRFKQLQQQQRSELEIIQDRYDEQKKIIEESTASEGEQYVALLEARKKFEEDSTAATKQNSDLRKFLASSEYKGLEESLGQLSTLMSSENRKIFEIGKATSLALAVMRTASGVALALETYPPPFNFIAAGATAAAGAIQIAQIQGTQFKGQAHAGMTNIPSEGTYLLDGGERVLAPEQNKDLTNFLNQKSPESGGSGVTVNLIESTSGQGSVNQRTAPDGTMVIDVFLADIRSDGPASRAVASTFGLQRRGS